MNSDRTFPSAHPTIHAREGGQQGDRAPEQRDVVWLEGYVSTIVGEMVRLYQSLDADRFIGIPTEAVLEVEEAGEPAGWIRVKLDAGTPVTLHTKREANISAGHLESKFRIGMGVARLRKDDDKPYFDYGACLFDCISASGPLDETESERDIRELRCMIACDRKRDRGDGSDVVA